jgi:hypothetical protein
MACEKLHDFLWNIAQLAPTPASIFLIEAERSRIEPALPLLRLPIANGRGFITLPTPRVRIRDAEARHFSFSPFPLP